MSTLRRAGQATRFADYSLKLAEAGFALPEVSPVDFLRQFVSGIAGAAQARPHVTLLSHFCHTPKLVETGSACQTASLPGCRRGSSSTAWGWPLSRCVT